MTPAVWGVPTLQTARQKPKWPGIGWITHIILAVSGVLNTSQRGTKSALADKWAHWLHDP